MAARLAVGEPSVERFETYVWACRQLGYQHPQLTVHAAQVRDWYAHDDGLDLRALDADCAALSAAATAADDAVRRHGELAAEMAGAWSGGGAGAAREFLWRHGQSAVAVRDGLRSAADTMVALRDDLWRAVDQKVQAVVDIDDRTLTQRAEWLAAAQTVTAGAGDRVAASELVDQQIKPFVDNDIRSDWLVAMHRAAASATAAYDAASARLDSGATSAFDVPGELGPRWEVPESMPAPALAATVPAAAVMSPPPTASTPAFDPPAAAPAPVAEPPAAAPLPAPASPMPSLGEMGGGMPSLGTGASGFGQQLADLIGGLVGSGASEATGEETSEGGVPDPPELDPADEPDEPDDSDESEDQDDPQASDEEPEPLGDPEPEPPAPPEPAATPVPPPPEPPVPPAVPEALQEEKTPCEIAADELPQVGE
ncbi:hypothetical protein [Mycolicibacterium sp. P9-64]|uniref:hypothetical protein n=1 Tax=Mycolicibacterium sp. P9-64 TaxID=2024612 RepID=UPI001F5BF85D|nr:hypothetical protein [Mycolicibacterium sp. P9-64]